MSIRLPIQLISEYEGAFTIENGLPVDGPLRGLLLEFGIGIIVARVGGLDEGIRGVKIVLACNAD